MLESSRENPLGVRKSDFCLNFSTAGSRPRGKEPFGSSHINSRKEFAELNGHHGGVGLEGGLA